MLLKNNFSLIVTSLNFISFNIKSVNSIFVNYEKYRLKRDK